MAPANMFNVDADVGTIMEVNENVRAKPQILRRSAVSPLSRADGSWTCEMLSVANPC